MIEITFRTYCRMRYSKSTASRMNADLNLSVGNAGNEVSKHQLDAVLHSCAPQEQKSSHIAEETSHCLTNSPWFRVPHKKRSKRRITCKQRTVVPDTGFPRGASVECPIASSVVACKLARKTRKIKRTANEIDSEVIFQKKTKSDSEDTLSRRSHIRGLPRRRLNCNNTETQELEKLDSKTFECYLENLWREFPEEKRISFTYLDCLWFSLYSKKLYKQKVLNWVKKKNILSKKYVFIPIVQWSHWSLLILCHFGETGPSESRTRCMLLLDSLQKTNPKRLEPEIRKFILDIYMTEERSEGKEQVKKIPLLVPKVPQQRNDKECGNFVLYYIKLFIESAPENFSVSEGFPYFMTEDWFTPQGLECFYQRLDSIRKTVHASDFA